MRTIHSVLIAGLCLGLTACPTSSSVKRTEPDAAHTGSIAGLAGEYDNHAERFSVDGKPAGPTAPPAIHYWISTPEGDTGTLLWRVTLPETVPLQEGRWLLRYERNGFVPYRPLNAAAEGVFATGARFKYEAGDWAVLNACTMKPAASRSGVEFAADPVACGALLPGIGPVGALLPLRFRLDGDKLRVVNVADQARGVDAATVSQRVRWFGGWNAINGGGPKASPENNDWHLKRDLKLHSEGGRIPLVWRDGTPSGYTLELARLTYRESNTEVLRLAVIEDATSKTLAYVWGDPTARRIGLNLGWLQVGLEQNDSGGKEAVAR